MRRTASDANLTGGAPGTATTFYTELGSQCGHQSLANISNCTRSYRKCTNYSADANDADDKFSVPQKQNSSVDSIDYNKVAMQNRKNSSKNYSSNKSKSAIGNLFAALFNLIKNVFLIIISLGVIFCSVSISVMYMKTRCEELQASQFDLESLHGSISERLVGQELAVGELTLILQQFQSLQIIQPHIVWCSGWMGTGKSKTMDILKHSLSNQSHVQYVLPTFIPSSSEALEISIRETVSQMNPCLKDIVIIDGWDDSKDDTVLNYIKELLRQVEALSLEDFSVNHLLVVVAGTRGSKAINREYISHRLLGKERVEMSLDSFVNIMKRTLEFDAIAPLAPLTIVPFLPLESEHVAACVLNELKYVKKLAKHKIITLSRNDALNEEAILNEVIALHTFFPPESPLMSSTGCKRVFPMLRLILGDQDSLQ